MADDSYKGSDGTDQPPINDLEGFHWGTPNAESYLDAKWAITYEGVVRANSTLRLLKQVAAANPGEFSAADAKGIEGEALFLRAHYHFEAWRMWGNVPYYREDDTDFRKTNLTVAEVGAEIIKDLDAAIALLPATPRNANAGRATSWAAKAYKGRVQVYAGNFAGALTTLREVRNSGAFALESSYDRVWTGFSTFANGKETILAYQASANDGEPNGENSNYGERLNFPYSGSHFGCCGFNQPTQNLVNFYKVGADGLPLALSNPGGWNASNANFSSTIKDPVDPRIDFTVGRDGVPYKDWGLYSASDGWVRDMANGGPYSAKKMAHEKASGAESSVGWQNTQTNSVNMHLFRYADMLLLLAEAEVEAGVARQRADDRQRDQKPCCAARSGTGDVSVGHCRPDQRSFDYLGSVQDQSLSFVPGSSLRAQRGSKRAQARAGDGRPAVVRSAAVGNRRCGSQRVHQRRWRRIREERGTAAVPCRRRAIRSQASLVSSARNSDRAEPCWGYGQADPEPRLVRKRAANVS